MFSQHVGKNLSAYCHGELSDEELRRVAEHLIGCQSCRREFEEIKLGVRFAEQLPQASAPASLWNEIEAALDKRTHPAARLNPQPARFIAGFGWQRAAALCALLLLVLAAGLIWYSSRQSNNASQVAEKDGPQQTVPQGTETNPDTVQNPSAADKPAETVIAGRTDAQQQTWEVARLAGTPTIGSSQLEGSGRLAVGQWLETDASSRAKINVADIGQVDIGPNSRVRLLGTRSTEHRLALQRGRLHAFINAPPRLFIVETPSATAIDLGCSYTLDVDDAGRSVLHVTSGWVALELKGRESIVPAGAICVTEPGKGPGTPYFDDASARFREALSRLDFQNGGAKALSIVLAESREYDTLTLWHLLSRVSGAERSRVYERMASLITPPQGVTREGVLRLDKGMLDLWKKELEWAWFE
jgi:ferric-dicitrate binding protein FerR (iron transport regulator)